MSCRLFDTAAFRSRELVGVDETAAVEGSVAQVRLRADVKSMRQAVLVDATNLTETWSHWHDANPNWPELLNKTLPPWTNSFVFTTRPWVAAANNDKQVREYGIHVTTHTRDEVIGRWGFNNFLEENPDVAHAVELRPWFLFAGRGAAATSALVHLFWMTGSGAVHGLEGIGASMRGETDRDRDIALQRLSFAFFVFQIANCRNVLRGESVYRPHMPRGLRNKSPKIKFHTLSISDTLVKREGQPPSGQPGNVPKHVVRGNFAHYTDENKLFGKYTGMFWRPMHIRGEAKYGIVGKEYELAAKE